jgi:hypothetical protein
MREQKNKMMKKISIGFLMFFYVLCYGQEQCNEMIVTNDPVAETTSIKSNKIVINDLTITIWSQLVNKFCYLDFIVKDQCIDKGSEIIICFKNDEKAKWYNTSYDFNCRGQSAMKVYQKNKELFTTEKISIIRVGTKNGNYYQVELNEEQSEKLLETLQCAFNRESWEKQIKYKKGV